jgi:metal-responsive CopG/Arc/MetJ family transcriptional regulator
VATSHPRVQVTVDPELAEAMDSVDPAPASRSRLIRDLALKGAEAARQEEERRREAIEHLKGIARGEIDFDFEALREIYEAREAGFD